MTATSDADERRIRRALDERGVAYAPQPPAAPGRERDWLDDVLDAQTETRPPGPPAPPDKPAATDGGEPRWDWQRLRHWPYARLTAGAAVALIPWYRGHTAALTWGHVLQQARAQASVGGAYVIAAVGLTVGLLWVHRRRSWIGWAVLTCAFIGGIDMGRLYDLVTLVTGATK